MIKVFNSQAINHQMKGNVDLAFETFLRSLDLQKRWTIRQPFLIPYLTSE